MEDNKKVLEVIKLISHAIIESGGETSRSEEVCERICSAFGIENINAFAIPTGIIITIGENDRTIMKRVKTRSTDFAKLEKANDISFRLAAHAITLDQAKQELTALNLSKPMPLKKKFLIALAGGASSAFFAALMGGGVFEFSVAFFSGFLIQVISHLFQRKDMYQFLISMLGGMICAFFACIAVTVFNRGNMDQIIVGSIMLLLPGIAMTNAIRDTISGNLLAGTARICEALLIALAVAAGVGIVLSGFVAFGGKII